MRFTTAFIAICMVVIAASFGAIVFLGFGFSPTESLATTLTVLTLLVTYNAFAGRARDRADANTRIADLARGTTDLARQVGELGRRLIVIEGAVVHAGERAREATEPLAAEMEVLGTLVKQLAESVAAHESALVDAVKAASAQSPSPTPISASPATAPAAGLPVDAVLAEALAVAATPTAPGVAKVDRVVGGRFDGMQRAEIVRLIRGALEQNRIDLYLQPIVTLPQRKVRYYEAVSRLRTEDGEQLTPPDYLGLAESGGLMPMLDNLMLFRCVQVVRRLSGKNREVGVFCNIAGPTLTDPEFFPQFSDFLAANKAIAPALIFEFAQACVRAMGPIERESLSALAQLGFRFSMDHVTDLNMPPRELAEQGFRFVKIPAALLLNRAASAAADIHAADLSNLLFRYGLELVAEKIESESTVVDLLDYDVRYGQGFLFSPPKPVRAEVLGGLVEAPAPAAPKPAANDSAPPAPKREPAATPQTPTPQAARGLAQLVAR
jgi:cyclic-di-GMP phosphodiesterase TipF (flagellum assembly factor)